MRIEPMTISFRHTYDKLHEEEFTTIRSKSFAKKISIGEIVGIKSPKESFKARVESVTPKRIAQMSLTLIQTDVAPFKIASQSGFVLFLNSLRAPAWQQATLQSEMAIITLRRV